MILTRFCELYAVELTLQAPAPVGGTRPLLIPVYMGEIDSAVGVLNEIHREHRRDVERNIHPRMPADDPRTWKPGWEEHVERLKPRELYRVVAYLMYATTLAGVVRAAYDDLMNKLETASEPEAARIRAAHEPRIEAAGKAFSPAMKVRNKVFAHTSFAKPDRKDDTTSMQYTSLQYLVGNAHGFGREGLFFGGKWTFDNEPNPGLTQLGVHNLNIETRHLLDAWYKLIDEAARTLIALPDADIMKVRSEAVKVRRLREANVP